MSTPNNARTSQAIELMMAYVERTGLPLGPRNTPPTGRARRYLWTDAFAVCNLLGLENATGDERFRELALRLVDQVHHVLGCHRPDDPRSPGWLSGLPDAEAETHPTSGGLRIGKPLPERAANEPHDSELEWDRDGQYFHYLTKWMHALDQVARATGKSTFNVWARELCVAAHHGFTYRSGNDKRMVWKASIDLSRPLVRSMGHHDPLDGFVTCTELEATARSLATEEAAAASGPDLTAEATDFAQMLDRDALATGDALGIGGLLADACRLAQLEHLERSTQDLIASLIAASVTGLRHYVDSVDLRAPAQRRLGFRELGLAIGLAGIPLLEDASVALRLGNVGHAKLEELARYAPLRSEIEAFWLRPEHRRTASWLDHADINDVMLATSLVPEGFLVLSSTSGR